MLISHSKQFIFIHIYKTAGTSITDLFVPYARPRDKMVYDKTWPTKPVIGLLTQWMHWEDDGHRQFTGFHKHATAAEVQACLPDEIFQNYFKFCFVRNPFDWLVSFYEYIKQTPRHRLKQHVENSPYKDFLVWYINQNPSRQSDFLVEPESKEILVDYLGYFENLSQDVASIQSRLSLKTAELSHKNPSFHRKKRDYRDYYDAESIALVEDYFRADLSILGYEFEGRYFSSNSASNITY